MKAKLQEKYIPPSYNSQLFSNMINLKQMSLSVAEYSAKFEDARLRCSEFHAEDQFAISTRFVNGLRFDIQKMVKLHAPHTVQDAYQKALEVEKFNRPSSLYTQVSPSHSPCHQTIILGPITLGAKSLVCVTLGHIAFRCPQRALALDVE